MADQLDNRPVFTIVMGCNGAGKSAWKRANQDRLPERYFDKDSIADGIGGWDTADARERTDAYVNAEIDKALDERRNFGVESTYSGRPGRTLVERAVQAGYRIEGVYIGTRSPDINNKRIKHRVDQQTGHWIDPRQVPDRYRHSLHNLRQTAHCFDELTIVDNSAESARGLPEPKTELVLENGRRVYEAGNPSAWVTQWKQRFEQARESRERTERKRAKGDEQGRRGRESDTTPREGASAKSQSGTTGGPEGKNRTPTERKPPQAGGDPAVGAPPGRPKTTQRNGPDGQQRPKPGNGGYEH